MPVRPRAGVTPMQIPANPHRVRSRRFWCLNVLVFCTTVGVLRAQTTSTANASPAAKEEVIELNPFEVKAESDTSYGALNSNSITGFRAELDKLPLSADVFSEQFIKDVATTNIEELMQNYGGLGVASSAPDSDAEFNQPGDRRGNFQMSARGLDTGAVKRDGFIAVGSLSNPGATAVGVTSTFDAERAEVISGPQGLLYGASGAGATVNLVPKQARFNRKALTLMYRIDQYGSKVAQFDYAWGDKTKAVRISLTNEIQRYRRVLIGGRTQGIYAQLAFKLPLRSILRVDFTRTENERINSTSVNDFAVSNANNDPRFNYAYTYLLATGRAGATNPVTGQPYPLGAIAKGGLTWDNVNSWAGNASSEYVKNWIYTAKLETQWTPWLSSQVQALYNDYESDRIFANLTTLAAPGFNGNPLTTWGSSSIPSDTEQPTRHKAFKASLLATNHLFHDRAVSQSVLAYDVDYAAQGPTDFMWYQADANWNLAVNGTSNLGRTQLGRLWWSVDNSPVQYPYFKPGWYSPRVTVNGVNYIRMQRNPRNDAWITPTNPLGLASLAGLAGVSGQNNHGFTQEKTIKGYSFANNTLWWGGRVGTILGVRGNSTEQRNPNTNTGATEGYSVSTKSNQSYNTGVNVAVWKRLRLYYEFSSTYNTPVANANDPLGNLPKTSQGTGHEVGLKYSTADGRLSGSVNYYVSDMKDAMVNAGTGVRDRINPTVFGDSFDGVGGGKNQWVNLDRTSSGMEARITANPVRNWRIQFSAKTQDGETKSDKVYPMLYNNQFYANSAGQVTFKDGTPFLVPTDAATITAQVNKRNTQVDPATLQASGTWVPLTTAMIGDPSSPYWAFNGTPTDNGRINGTNLTNVFTYFVSPARGGALTGAKGLPISDIQYTWPDPTNSGGVVVVARKGEKTVGYAEYTFSLTNFYSFTKPALLRGIGVGASVNAGYRYRTFYFNSPDGSRQLYRAPNLATADLIGSYTRKFKRFAWTTQINVKNAFNGYKVGILPNNGTGYTDEKNLSATFYGQPRLWLWTNTLSF